MTEVFTGPTSGTAGISSKDIGWPVLGMNR